MADTAREAVGRFYTEHRATLVKLAQKFGAVYPEDAVQAAMVRWLARRDPGRIDFACFVRQLRAVLHFDCYVQTREGEDRPYIPRPQEVHGDIDHLWRTKHGRRVSPKKGAD